MKVALIVGARPNFVKAAALLPAFDAVGFETTLIHTGQHFSKSMNEDIFRDLELRAPDINICAAGSTAARRFADMLNGLVDVLDRRHPDMVVVVGDCDSTLAGALAARKCKLRLAHVEAGLRCHDRTMEEEVNRIMVDTVSDELFASEQSAVLNLGSELSHSSRQKVHMVGNVMVDTLLRFKAKALLRPKIGDGEYAVLTLHRAENVDDQDNLREVLEVIYPVSRFMPIVFPVHPRCKIPREFVGDRMFCLPPLGYLDFVNLIANAKLAMTDSGGVQEETTALGVPCLTLRLSTERPATISCGTNAVVGYDSETIDEATDRIVCDQWDLAKRPPLWDGHAAERIAHLLAA